MFREQLIQFDAAGRVQNPQQMVNFFNQIKHKLVVARMSGATGDKLDISDVNMDISCQALFHVKCEDAPEYADRIDDDNGLYIVDGIHVNSIYVEEPVAEKIANDPTAMKSSNSSYENETYEEAFTSPAQLKNYFENKNMKLTGNQAEVLFYLFKSGESRPSDIGRRVAGKDSRWACSVLSALMNKGIGGLPLVAKDKDPDEGAVFYYSPITEHYVY